MPSDRLPSRRPHANLTENYENTPQERNATRLSSRDGWVLSDQFERMLADVLEQAGIGDGFRRALPAPASPGDARPASSGEFTGRYEAVFVISVAARLAEMHPNTLRKYDREGLVRPTRSEGRQRRYSESDVRRLRIVRTLAETYQINLNGVRLVLDMVRLITGVVNMLEEIDPRDAQKAARIGAGQLKNLLAGLGA